MCFFNFAIADIFSVQELALADETTLISRSNNSRNEHSGVHRSPEVAVRHLFAADLLLLRHLLVSAEQVCPMDGISAQQAQGEGGEGSKAGKALH